MNSARGAELREREKKKKKKRQKHKRSKCRRETKGLTGKEKMKKKINRETTSSYFLNFRNLFFRIKTL